MSAKKSRRKPHEKRDVKKMVLALGDVALDCLRRELPRNPRLAYKVMEAIGGFPDLQKESPTVVQQPTAAEVK
jgi:hypothetical protein